jgi:hypothetical protein
MNRTVILAGFVVLAAAMALREFTANRAMNRLDASRPIAFGELVVVAVQHRVVRWALLAAWLWLGWHVFARVSWR